MRLRYKCYDGGTFSISSEDCREILPYRALLSLPQIKEPYSALFMHDGRVWPVTGPLPSADQLVNLKDFDQCPWLLLCEDYIQVVWGLPEIEEDDGELSA